MPWTSSDAKRFSKSAGAGGSKSPGSKQWAAIANSVLQKTGDEGKAVRIASGVVKARKAGIKSPPKG